MKKQKAIQDSIEEKVDSDQFDQEIAYIKAYLDALQATPAGEKPVITSIVPQQGVPTKDINKLKELIPKIEELQKNVQELQTEKDSLEL